MTQKSEFERKKPRQARSRAMYDDILDATFRVLAERGFDQTTSTRIAETAGISVGSFYQYFANRDAAILALVDRQRLRFQDLILRAFKQEDDEGLGNVLVRTSEAIAQSYTICPKLPPELKARITPHLDPDAEGVWAERNRDLILQTLSRHEDELRGNISIDGAAFVVSSLIEGVLCMSPRLRVQPVDTEEAGREYLTLLRSYLLAEPADADQG